jgi:hypothetical protein
MPRIPHVQEQKRIDFVKSIVRRKVTGTGLNVTAACKALAPSLDLSYATLFKALDGKFTFRTVRKMINAGWFTDVDFQYAGTTQSRAPRTPRQNKTRTANDQAQQKEREKAAFKRGYSKGKTDGFTAGVRHVQNSTKRNSTEYTRGYNDGLRDSRNVRRNSNASVPSSLPMDRLNKLFRFNLGKGSTIGEIAAARKAAGVTLARWIKAQFGEDVTIDMS